MSLLSMVGLLAAAGPANASERWEEAGSGAVAILPLPSQATEITGGSLVCAEQVWSLRLRAGSAQLRAPLDAKVTIDKAAFAVDAEQGAGVISLPVSPEMLEALKRSSRMVVIAGAGDDALRATFALRGSQKVIEAVAPRCSPVDMAPFQAVVLSDTDPAVELAQPLLAEETRLFREATSGTPKLAATRVDRGEGREMLFATLCGSSWYYGQSGCSLFGYVRQAPEQDWREAYNTEGMALYVDPDASNGGWPNLVTLELPGGITPMHWVWSDDAYVLRDPQVAEDGAMPDGLDP